MAEAVERGWAPTGGTADKQSAVLDVERAIKFRAASRASSRASEKPAPGRAGVPSARAQAPSSQGSDARSSGGSSRDASAYGAYSIAAGTVSSGTGIGSETGYARHYLTQHLSADPRETAFAQRVAKDAKSSVVARKIVLSSIGAAMEGIGIAFRGERGADTLAGWKNVTGDPSRRPVKKLPARKLDATGFTQLGYIERGKTESLAQIGDAHVRQQQVLPLRACCSGAARHAARLFMASRPAVRGAMRLRLLQHRAHAAGHARSSQVLATARCFGTLIEQLEALSRGGTAHRQRIVMLGGAQVLTSACRFIRDEDLLLKCVTCLFRLAHDFDLRRHLVKEDVRAPEALGAVLCRPHLPEVVSVTCDTLNLMCLEGDVTPSLPDYGVLNALMTLGLKVPPTHEPLDAKPSTLLLSWQRATTPSILAHPKS